MTKQEQIVEMTQIICGSCKDGICLIDKTSCTRDCSNKSLEESEALYNAGYRKADEVRKETAKEFADKLKAIAKELTLFGEKGREYCVGCVVLTDNIDELLKQFGLEVEE